MEHFQALADLCRDRAAASKLDLPGWEEETALDRVTIVAELTTNHFGDLKRLATMMRLCRDAGADLVKLQIRDVDNFYSAEQLAAPYASPFGATFGDYRRQIELSVEDFRQVDALSRQLGIGWFASVLDRASFDRISQFNPRLVKIPSTVSEHVDFISYVCEHHAGDIVISTGMTDCHYENFILNSLKIKGTLYLLHCNSAYPTPVVDCNIAVVKHYSDLAKSHAWMVPGYSSHDQGAKGSVLAVAAGARMVEKHVKLGTTDWAHFDSVALDIGSDAFAHYVSEIREAEQMMGDGRKRITASEHHKYRVRP